MLFTRNRATIILLIVCLIFVFSTTKATILAKEIIDDDSTYIVKSYLLAYTINQGDTLWDLSKKYEVSIEDLKKANHLESDLIITGDILKIPRLVYIIHDEEGVDKTVSISKTKGTVRIASLTSPDNKVKTESDDRYWLAKIIEAEAGVESLDGKTAVGAVVINRVDEDWFPDTIKEVIFQKYKGVYQFTPVGNGRINRVEPSQESYEAADRALAGEDPTDGALYFYNPKISKSKFFKNKVVLTTIGNHRFFQ